VREVIVAPNDTSSPKRLGSRETPGDVQVDRQVIRRFSEPYSRRHHGMDTKMKSSAPRGRGAPHVPARGASARAVWWSCGPDRTCLAARTCKEDLRRETVQSSGLKTRMVASASLFLTLIAALGRGAVCVPGGLGRHRPELAGGDVPLRSRDVAAIELRLCITCPCAAHVYGWGARADQGAHLTLAAHSGGWCW
jgi:hypothetical protein